jgi:hypothetical protein
MSLFRRLRDVALRVPAATTLELPDQRAAHRCPGDVRRVTDAALRRVADVRLAAPVARWVGDLAAILSPYADGDAVGPVPTERLAAAAHRLVSPLDLSTRLGTAFAEVEVGLRPIDAGKSDAVVATALGFASFLQTRFGPPHLGFYMWRSSRVGYFLARTGPATDPSSLLPTGEELTIVFNEVVPRYESTTQAMQLAWDTLVQPDGAHA